MGVFIIAEAGVNHNGSLELAKKMVDIAKDSGADCIKFQTFVTQKLVSKTTEKADYQKKQTNPNETQEDMLKKLELSFESFRILSDYCKSKDILFMSTPFDLDSLEFLNSIGMTTWKIPSGDITNLPYLEYIAKLNKPVILSTGMSTLKEVEDAVRVFVDRSCLDLTLLHCTSEYPTPFNVVNLKAMQTLYDTFGHKIGYSDHTNGIEVAIAAVAMGATVIEKHFTLNREMEGPDHKASLEPKELKKMIDSIRNVEAAMGTGQKLPTEIEFKNMAVVRKSIVAKKVIKKGTEFTEENLTVKRPGTGISPMRWYDIVGKVATRDYDEDEIIAL